MASRRPNYKSRTKRKVSRTKRAAKARARGRSVYKVKGGWAVNRGRKRRRSRRRTHRKR